ncbi:MAG TPA: heparan-alpha-glucosaminide N-acetyltransferase domain-containing protein [Rhizomicrobium sp.]|nr:heparan-alpha-glucosaminide N-acetyltransferase domain-containing protein [Rhizomicrobium sp.]
MEQARFRSLDVFRGMAICLMIVVNTPGAGSEPWPILDHADWFGFTAADIVFPSFLFAVGNALAFGSLKSMSESEFWRKTLRRTAIILALGILFHWFPFGHMADQGWVWKSLSEVRLPGVLQRIALCYCFGAIAARYLDVRGLLALSAALLLGYWALLLATEPPDLALTKLGNIGNAVDRFVFGLPHLYHKDYDFDPEGLPGTLPAIVNVIFGYLAGLYARRHGASRLVATRYLGVGIALFLAALAWHPFFPIGKKLWTSSFVLLTVGMDLIVLAGLIAWIDLGKHRFGVRFFEIFGRNPIFIYIFAIILDRAVSSIPVGGESFWKWLGKDVMEPILPGPPGSLVCAIGFMLACWLMAWALDRRNIVIKV